MSAEIAVDNQLVAEKILNGTIKAYGLGEFLILATCKVEGEIDPIYYNNDGHIIAANSEVLVYVNGEDEPYVLFVETYEGIDALMWG